VVNTGDTAIDLKIEVLLPEKSELKAGGYAPIPDLSWITLERSEFKEVKPGAEAVTDVIISIPGDEKYRGRKFQVFIWSRTVGRSIGVGLKSKLLLTVREK